MLLSIRRCELHSISFTEFALRLAVERHAVQPARIVTHLLTVLAFHRHQVFFLVPALDAGILSGLNTTRLTASRIAYYVARLVLCGPLPVRSCDFLPRYQHARFVLVVSHLACALHRAMDDFVYLSARLIVGRND